LDLINIDGTTLP